MLSSVTQLSVLTLLASSVAVSGAEHGHHKHKYALFDEELPTIHKRGGNDCEFPTDKGLVAVNKDGTGGGWAISKDQTCKSGSWCPYACPPGYLSAQWDSDVTSYSYPGSQYGGLKCNSDGTLSKGNKDKDYCYKGAGTVKAKNNIGKNVAFCQTVLPGNEEMLIPTNVDGNSEHTLAVPGTDYWASTAAHYYVNPPGVSTSDACTWGTSDKDQGNWAPYVVGANQDDNKNTYVKIGWNPIYLDSKFKNTKPSFGIRITCDDESKCNGLKCEIDPTKGVNKIQGSTSSGAGNGNYCVVTAEQGATAKIEVFSSDSNSNDKRDFQPVQKAFNATSLITAQAAAATGTVSNSTDAATANNTTSGASSANATSTPAAISKSGASSGIVSNTLQTVAVVFSVIALQNFL